MGLFASECERGPRRRPRQEYSSRNINNIQRRHLLSLTIFICSVLLRRQVDASGSSGIQRIISSNTLRGGGSEADAPVGQEDEENTKQQHKKSSWQVDSLFRLNDDVKSEAASVSANDAVPLVKAGPHNNSRGGALTMVKPRRFQWLAPLDTSRVAPLSSRLMQDDQDDVDVEQVVADVDVEQVVATATGTGTAAENVTATEASAEVTSFNQMWWGNVWDQQLPTDDDDDNQNQDQAEAERGNDETEQPKSKSQVTDQPVRKKPSQVTGTESPERKKQRPSQGTGQPERKLTSQVQVQVQPERKKPSERNVKRKASPVQKEENIKSTRSTDALPAVDKDLSESMNGNVITTESTPMEEQETVTDVTLVLPRADDEVTESPISPFVSSGYVSDEKHEFSCRFIIFACVHLTHFLFFIFTHTHT
jgi:hypothetical protein